MTLPFVEPPLFVFRRGPNLCDMLVKASINTVSNHTPLRKSSYPRGNCAQCNNTHEMFDFKHPRSEKSYPVRDFITCNKKNVIFILARLKRRIAKSLFLAKTGVKFPIPIERLFRKNKGN